jgi:hypothetical protein
MTVNLKQGTIDLEIKLYLALYFPSPRFCSRISATGKSDKDKKDNGNNSSFQ